MARPYKRFAEVYDTMEADEHSIRMVEYTRRVIRKFKVQATSGLDLCCGTGTALKLLSDEGLMMSGLDQSAEMLARAKEKLRGRPISLYRQSLPRFKITDDHIKGRYYRFGVVTCFYDSLNYLLTQRDLQAAFRSVYAHLEPGGFFIFDMNTEEALKVLWGDVVYSGVRDDLAWIWRNEYDETKKSADICATFFVKKGRGWERFDEVHTERAYENGVIKRLLKEAGLQIKGFYRCYTFERPTRKTNRIAVVAKRPMG